MKKTVGAQHPKIREMDKNELKLLEGGILWYIIGGLVWDFLSDPSCISGGWKAGCAAASR